MDMSNPAASYQPIGLSMLYPDMNSVQKMVSGISDIKYCTNVKMVYLSCTIPLFMGCGHESIKSAEELNRLYIRPDRLVEATIAQIVTLLLHFLANC